MSKVLGGLNAAQKEAVTTTEGPLLIIAGAGTGKTTVITRRIAYLIEQKLAKPSEILALTFTEKSAGEMEERVDILVPYGYIDTWISTFHSFGNRVLQENAIDLGLSPDFKVLTHSTQILFFQQNLFAFELDYYRPLANPTKFIEAILSFISRCKDEDISPIGYKKYVRKLKKTTPRKLRLTKKEWISEIKRQEELAQVYDKYENLKAKAGLVDFGDQLTLTLKLFREKPAVLKKYQKQFKYILVDEFQDTNWTQNEIVKILSYPRVNVCVVADDDQSIYRFRGAAISNVLEFKKTFPKAKIVTLLENYRSSQPILDSAYRLIRHNDPDRLEVQQAINKKLKSVRRNPPAGGPPKEIYTETLSDEADQIAEKIAKLVKNKNSKLKYKDIAILIRANTHADPYQRSLNMKGIPSKFVGSRGLYNQEEVKLLISLLSAISNFDDSPNLYNLASSEIYKLPLQDAIKVMDFAKRKSRSLRYVFSNIEDIDEVSYEGKEIIRKINDDLAKLIQLSRKENAGRVLYEFLKGSGYLSQLEQVGGVESQTKFQNIAKFFDKIREFSEIASLDSVRNFMDWLGTMREAGDDPATSEFDPDTEAVNIMSVHAAKGLEFGAVFLVNLVSGRFPSRQRSEVISIPDELVKETLPSGDFHMQEERRLFYVGMTRAMDHLYFSWSHNIGGRRSQKVSPFVLEALDKPISSALVNRTSALEKIERHAKTEKSVLSSSPSVDKKVIRLTQGSIDDYQTCAYKYRYVHVLRLPILRHHAVVYGSALHATVAAYYRARIQKKKLSLTKLLEIFEKTWISEGFLSIEHEQRRLVAGKKVIEDFWRREKNKKTLPTFIEKEFRFGLRDVLVTGRYDRVDVGNPPAGGVRIIDFKSTEGRSKEDVEKSAKNSTQLKVYALAYYKNYKVIPEFVGIYDLGTGIVGGYSPTKKMLEETGEEILEISQKLRSNLKEDKFPAKPKYYGRVPACNYCAFNSICPFSQARR